MRPYLGEGLTEHRSKTSGDKESSVYKRKKEDKYSPAEIEEYESAVSTPTYSYFDPLSKVAAVNRLEAKPAEAETESTGPSSGYYFLSSKYNSDITPITVKLDDWEDLKLLYDTQVRFESNYDPNAVSYAGAVGLSQMMAPTFQMAKDRGWVKDLDAKRTDPVASLQAQTGTMNYLLNRSFVQAANGSEEQLARALGSYQWGEGNVMKAIKRATEQTGDPNQWIRYAPSSTQEYMFDIISTFSERKRSGYKPRLKYKWGGILFINSNKQNNE